MIELRAPELRSGREWLVGELLVVKHREPLVLVFRLCGVPPVVHAPIGCTHGAPREFFFVTSVTTNT